MNSTAEYMVAFGMQNLSHFAETPGGFGNLQYYLDRDMGSPLPTEILPNFRLGKIIDVSPPQFIIAMVKNDPT